MMTKRPLLILILVAALVQISSCTKVEKIEKVGLTPSSLTINLRATEGDAFDFSVSKSLNVLDNASIKPLKNAKIKLYENSVLVETIVYNTISQSYLGATIAKTKTPYKIECTASGFGTCTSEFFVPEKPENGAYSLKIVRNQNASGGVFYDSGSFQEGQISFILKDNSKEANGYIISLKENWTKHASGGGGVGYYGYSSWECLNQGVTSFGNYNFYSSAQSAFEFYIYDDLFSGKELPITLKTNSNYNSFISGQDTLLSYDITIYSLSDGYYRHCFNRKQYENGKGDFFKEPVYIYSNVNNGLGACGGVALKTFSIPFKI